MDIIRGVKPIIILDKLNEFLDTIENKKSNMFLDIIIYNKYE